MATTGDIRSRSSTTSATSNPDNSLLRAWRARGFFGGLAAIGLAILAQYSLVTQARLALVGPLYAAAILLLIASLLQPHPLRRRKSSNNEVQTHAQILNTQPPFVAPTTATSLPVRKHSSTSGSPEPGPKLNTLEEQVEIAPYRLSTTKQSALFRAWQEVGRGQVGWLGVALVLLLAGASAFALERNISDPFGGWLWAAALIMLLSTSILMGRSRLARSMFPSPSGDFFTKGLPNIPRRWEVLLIGSVLVASLLLRVINLEYMPGIFGDEGERGMEARAINEGKPSILFGHGWWGVPNLYFYLVSFMLRIFGDNMVGDRMLSVISGVVAVWFVYKTGRLLWGSRSGLIAGAMLAVSPLALQFSRLAGESTPMGTLWIAGAYYFFMALRHLRWSDWALSGILWGFSLYFYAAGKLIIPIVCVLGIYCVVRWHRHFIKSYAPGFALLLLGFGLTFMPYGLFSAQETPPWQSFTGRAQETSIFSPWNQAQAFASHGIPYDPSQAAQPLLQNLLAQPLPWAQLILQQLRITTEVLYKSSDRTQFYQITEHGGTMLAPLWAAIALLGLAYAAWKFWDARFGLLNIIFWGGMLGAALTMDTPSVQRLAGAWPLLMLFPAALLDRVFAAAWPLNIKLARRWATMPIVGLLLFLAADSYREYFVHYASLCPYCDATTQARFVQAQGEEYKVYQMGIGQPNRFFGYGSTRFLARGVEGTDLAVPSDFFPVTDNGSKGLAFLIYPHNYDYRPLIRLFYPGGEETAVKGGNGVEYFTSYRVTREQMRRFQTSHATYTSAGGTTVSRDEPNLGTEREDGTEWAPPEGVVYPVSVTWQAGVVAPQYKLYQFQVDGPPDARLVIDGRFFSAGGTQGRRQVEVVLAKGMHDIRLEGTLADADRRLSLGWSATAKSSPIAAEYLYNGSGGSGREGTLGGLSGEVGPLSSVDLLNGADPFGGIRPEVRRNDPFIGFREATVAFGQTPFMARWRGNINITSPGDYTFRLNSNGPSVILIDGSFPGNTPLGEFNGRSTLWVPLSVGSHSVEIRYAWGGGPAIMEWYWSTPDGQYGLVPTTVLSPASRSWLPGEMTDAPGTLGYQGKVLVPEAVFGAEAGLANPQGLAIDRDGRLYVGDKGNGRIVAFSSEGKVLRTWGKPGNEQALQPGEFLDIQDIAVSDDGVIAVTDFRGRRVQLFDTQGGLLGVLDASTLQADGPNGAAWSVTGRNLYIADTVQSKLQKLTFALDNSLQSVQTVPVDEQNKLEQCLDIAPDSAGRMYVIDIKDRILQINPDGTTNTYRLLVGKNAGGSRLAISPDGSRLYMTDPDRKRVAMLNTSNGNLSYFGEVGSNPGQFGEPSGIAIGGDGRVYVLDRLNNNIQVFRLGQ